MQVLNPITLSLLLSSFLGCYAGQPSTQSIEVINNSTKDMQIGARTNDGSLRIDHTVPALFRSFIMIELIALKSLQDRLFEAILNDNPEEVRYAIRSGANVNIAKDGKSPLLWAVTFQRSKAAQTLLQYGAK